MLLSLYGMLHTEPAPQDNGIIAARALYAVRNAAYDHVRSYADSGLPSSFEYCSDSDRSEGVYVRCGTISSHQVRQLTNKTHSH